MSILRRFALCGLSLLAMAASASAEPIVPVNDDPPMAGFPEGTVLDVLGIKLGMTPDEVRAAYGKPLEEETHRIRMVNSDTGASFDIEYLYKLHTPAPDQRRIIAEHVETQIEITFGSPFVANRAVRILNSFNPPEDTPMSEKSFMASVEKKYGRPSAVTDAGHNPVWVYGFNGKVEISRVPEIYYPETDVAGYRKPGGGRKFEDGPMPICWQASEFGTFGVKVLPYRYKEDRYISPDGCVGGLVAESSVDKSHRGDPIIAYDQRRIDLDIKALDEAIKKALSESPTALIKPKL